jgi:hypothetical protein
MEFDITQEYKPSIYGFTTIESVSMKAIGNQEQYLDSEIGILWATYSPGYSADRPVLIADEDDFLALGGGNSGWYTMYAALTADMDFSGVEWVTLAVNSMVIDGRGHVIKNLTIGNQTGNTAGLFQDGGVLDSSGFTVRNLGVENGQITIREASAYYPYLDKVGAFKERTEGLYAGMFGTVTVLENCYASGGIDIRLTSTSVRVVNEDQGTKERRYGATHLIVGGLVSTAGSLTDCRSHVTVWAETVGNFAFGSRAYDLTQVGGLAASLQSFSSDNGVIGNCGALGDITVKAPGQVDIGGLAAGVSYADISASFASGNITADIADIEQNQPCRIGGFIGYLYSGKMEISDSYAAGDVTVTTTAANWFYVGGFIGYYHDYSSGTAGAIQRSYAAGDVSVASGGTVYAGGFLGTVLGNGQIEQCVATGSVTAQGNAAAGTDKVWAAGLVYLASQSGADYTLVDCYRYEGQSFSITSGTDAAVSTPSSAYGTACSVTQLDSKAFYTDVLGWSDSVWAFDDLAFAQGKLPILIVAS